MEEILLTCEEHMEKALTGLAYNFGSVRTGRANPQILDRVKVDYYGVPTPITQMSAVKAADAHMLTVEPWDKSMLNAIEKAIIMADLGVNPSNDGMTIRLPFPALTEERRKDFVKQCKNFAEEGRVAVRNARRDANTRIERKIKEDGLSEDEKKRYEDQVQKMTDKYIAKVDEAFKKKEAELMEI